LKEREIIDFAKKSAVAGIEKGDQALKEGSPFRLTKVNGGPRVRQSKAQKQRFFE
jgi:hypothetical protein